MTFTPAMVPLRDPAPDNVYVPETGSIELPRLRTGRISDPPRTCAAPVLSLYDLREGFSRIEETILYWGMIPLRPLVLVGLPNASTDAYSDPPDGRRTILNDTGRRAPAPRVNDRVVART